MNYKGFADNYTVDLSDLEHLQEITDSKTIIECVGDCVILNRYKHNFEYLMQHTIAVAALCWNNRDERGNKLQHTMIKFKTCDEETITYELPLNRFLTSLVYIRAVIDYITEIDLDSILIKEALNEKRYNEILKNVDNFLKGYGYLTTEIQVIIDQISYDWKILMIIFSACDMQILTADNLFLDHYKESEIIRDINNTWYPNDMQTVDIVEENARRYKILEEEMIKRKAPFFLNNKYTKILKPKQMEELFINYSQAPDGRDLIPVTMNGNGFKAGYHDLDTLYVGAIGARVPDIMNTEKMGKAGYFGRNLWILTYGTLSKTVYDCGSVNPIPIEIDECALEMMDGRYYYETKDSGVLKILDKHDTHLLGKKLYFRSPATCNLNEDCCHVCYGTKALRVGDLPGGFIYTTEMMSKDIGQKILSAKHLLKTNSEKIETFGNFEKYFTLESATVIPLPDKRYDIYIPENYQDNVSEEMVMYIGKDMEKISISHYANIYIPDDVLSKAKKITIENDNNEDVTYLKLTSTIVNNSQNGALLIITPINIMMTQRYMDMMKLFEHKISKFDSIEDVVTYLMHLLHKTIPIYSTHGEIIIGRHVKSLSNSLLRPNWLNPDEPYQMMGTKVALVNIEGFCAGLASEQTDVHLYSPIFDKRNEIKRVGPHSFIDYLYGEELM